MKKVCMIFTEGQHDIAFVKKVLTLCCDAVEYTKIQLNAFPKPLSLIFIKYISEHESSTQDLSLDMVQNFFLPDKVFVKDDWFIMLFRTAGKDNVKQVRDFIFDLKLALKPEYIVDIKPEFSDEKYIFINDADDKSFEQVIEHMKKTYFPIVDSDTNETYLTESDGNFYVWHGSNGTGTLEDILIKLLDSSESEIKAKSEQYVKEAFKNLTSPNDIPTQAKQYKAILTCAGQGKLAGASLSSILMQGKLIKDEILKADKNVQKFARFLNNIIT